MTQQPKFITAQAMVGRPDDWRGEMLAGVYELDVELAVRESMTEQQWNRWREDHPDALAQVVAEIGKRLSENLVIDARLDEYVAEAIKELKNGDRRQN